MFNKLIIILTLTIEATLLLAAVSASASADQAVGVDRVRWKKRFLSWRDHSDYPEWKNQGIWTEFRKKTYISDHWKPSRSAARTLIMLVSGQQGSSGSSGSSNCLSGQDSSWDSGWGKGDKTKWKNIKGLSLASKLMNSGQFRPHDTFFSIVFNSNFNWGNTPNAKNKAVRAFSNWFLKHGYSSNVDRIILLGSSRGGTLAMRMAKNILQRPGWKNVPVYVGLLDAVPNTNQNELETGQARCTNPLNSNYFSRKANLNKFFGGLNKPKIRHIITGAPVILGTVHSFCANSASWYEQSWANLKHKEIGRCNAKEGAPYNQWMMDQGINKLYYWVIDQL